MKIDFREYHKAIAAFALSGVILAGVPAFAQSHPAPAATELNSTLYIGSAAVNVRSGPGTSNGVASVLRMDEKVTVYDRHGDWSRISPRGQAERWVYTPLLREAPRAAHNYEQRGNKAQPAIQKPFEPQRSQPQKATYQQPSQQHGTKSPPSPTGPSREDTSKDVVVRDQNENGLPSPTGPSREDTPKDVVVRDQHENGRPSR